MYGSGNAGDQITTDSNLGDLECDGAGVANNTCINFDEAGLPAGQRPVGYLLGQISALQEDTQIVVQSMKLQAIFVLRHAFARQPSRVDRLLTFFDVLLCCPALVLEQGGPVWFHWQVGYNKADPRE